jgi:hypothetical protein
MCFYKAPSRSPSQGQDWSKAQESSNTSEDTNPKGLTSWHLCVNASSYITIVSALALAPVLLV